MMTDDPDDILLTPDTDASPADAIIFVAYVMLFGGD